MHTELTAMHAAYVKATGLDVKLTPNRERHLSELAHLGITAADVLAVMKELKRRVDSNRREDECYRQTSLIWENCMAQPEKFESRALLMRQAELRKPKKMPSVAVTTGDVTRLVEAQPEPAKIIDVSAALHKLANDVRKQA